MLKTIQITHTFTIQADLAQPLPDIEAALNEVYQEETKATVLVVDRVVRDRNDKVLDISIKFTKESE